MQSKIGTKNPFILILYGYPGSGKSLFARQFAKEIQNTIHIHSDKIKTELGSKLKSKGLDNPEIHSALIEYMINEFLTSGFNVILDTPVLRKSDRKKARKLAAANKAKLVMAWLQIDPDSAYDRLKRRDKRKTADKYADNYTRSEFESIINSSQNPDDEDYVVISGKHTFHTQRSAVFAKLESLGLLRHDQTVQKKIRPELVNLVPKSLRGKDELRRRNISIR